MSIHIPDIALLCDAGEDLAGFSSRRMWSLASAAGYEHNAPVLAAPSQADALDAIRVC